MLPVTWATVRVFLHVLAATIWVGGQLTLAGLVLDGELGTLRAQHGATARVVKLRVPPDQTERAANALARHPKVTSCERRDQFLVIGTDEPNCNFVLALLLDHDIRVLQFAEHEASLEEIFMRSTAGKVT